MSVEALRARACCGADRQEKPGVDTAGERNRLSNPALAIVLCWLDQEPAVLWLLQERVIFVHMRCKGQLAI